MTPMSGLAARSKRASKKQVSKQESKRKKPTNDIFSRTTQMKRRQKMNNNTNIATFIANHSLARQQQQQRPPPPTTTTTRSNSRNSSVYFGALFLSFVWTDSGLPGQSLNRKEFTCLRCSAGASCGGQLGKSDGEVTVTWLYFPEVVVLLTSLPSH